MLQLRCVFLFSLFPLFIGCGFFPRYAPEGVRVEEPSVLDEDQEVVANNDQKEADIVVVVDTSYGMVRHLEGVGRTFRGFVGKLSPVLWKLAFTNADYDNNAFSYYGRDLFSGKTMSLELQGKILPFSYLYYYTPRRDDIFVDTLKRYTEEELLALFGNQHVNPCDLPPYCQGSIRNPIRSLVKAFSVNSKMFRENATFVGIIFTNGDNTHNEENMIDKVMGEFRKHHGPNKKLQVYSIAIIPGDRDCFQHDQSLQYKFAESAYSTQIHRLVSATKGKAMSICAPSYVPLAEEIVASL